MREINKATINKVEHCVCDYFNLDYNQVVCDRDRTNKCVTARKFIMCILHDEFGYSIKQLSEYYNISGRWVREQYYDVRDLCVIYKEYKKHYDVLTTVLLDLDFA
jgi:hypothetical protein